MKLFKTIIPALIAVLGAGFTACSDDDDYIAGQASPGAFFAEGLPTEQLIEVEGHSFTVPVNRTGADAPASYEVSITDPSGLFTIPSTVSFDGQSLATDLVVSYDPEKVVLGQAYKLTFNIKGASDYGLATYTLTVTRAYPRKTIPFPDGHNTCAFVYGGIFSGVDPELPVSVSYNPTDPYKDVIVKVGSKNAPYLYDPTDSDGGFPGAILDISIPDGKNVLADGTIPVFVPLQVVCKIKGTDIAVCDLATFYNDVMGNPAGYEHYKESSYYNPETGVFALNIIYCVPSDPGSYYGKLTYEYVELAGFPDYSAEVVYNGIFLTPNRSASVEGTVTLGSDVAKALVALVPGSDENAAVTAVMEGTAEGIQELKESGDVSFPVSGDGDYVLAVVTYDAEGEMQEFATARVKVTLGGSEFESMGLGKMQDGWVFQLYKLNPADYVFDVEIGKSTKKQNVYALINPYGERFPDKFNVYEGKAEVAFEATPGWVSMPAQAPDYGVNMGGGKVSELTIGNYEGHLAENNPDVTHEEILEFLISKNIEPSTIEDGIVYINSCLFGLDGPLQYVSNDKTVIAFPDAKASAKLKARAESVAAPKIRTISQSMFEKHYFNKSGKYAKPFLKVKKIDSKMNVVRTHK